MEVAPGQMGSRIRVELSDHTEEELREQGLECAHSLLALK